MRNIKLEKRIISEKCTLTDAVKQMDAHSVKLLFILKDDYFIGLITIGDIQRALIGNKPFTTPVIEIIRKDLIVFYDTDPLEKIRSTMLKYRIECMPILDSNNCITNVIFWEDLFEETHQIFRELNVPVVIMAGGKGTRLKPLTNVIPKPLIPIGDRPIIEEIISEFEKHGINHFYISANYKYELIKFHFENLVNKNYDVDFIIEKDFFGTAGSLRLLKGEMTSTFFVSNCDILIDSDYAEIMDFHRENNNVLTVVASLKHYKIPYGTIQTGNHGSLVDLIEKPEMTFFINTGLYILEPKVLDHIPPNQFYNITDLILLLKDTGFKVGVFPISENSWKDMGEWPEYQKIIKNYIP